MISGTKQDVSHGFMAAPAALTVGLPPPPAGFMYAYAPPTSAPNPSWGWPPPQMQHSFPWPPQMQPMLSTLPVMHAPYGWQQDGIGHPGGFSSNAMPMTNGPSANGSSAFVSNRTDDDDYDPSKPGIDVKGGHSSAPPTIPPRRDSEAFSTSRERSGATRGVCWRMAKSGTCHFGSSCRYSHDDTSNSRPPPATVPSSPVAVNAGKSSDTRVQYCYDFQRGECDRGTSCHYIHEHDPARQKPCWQFLKTGTCPFDDRCKFKHVRNSDPSVPGYSPQSKSVTTPVTPVNPTSP